MEEDLDVDVSGVISCCNGTQVMRYDDYTIYYQNHRKKKPFLCFLITAILQLQIYFLLRPSSSPI